MAPRVYNDRGEKLCKCPLHIGDGEGTFLPLVRFNINKRGKRAGKPISVCKEGWRLARGLDPKKGWAPNEEIEPLYARLMQYYDSNAALCNDLGLPREYFSRHRIHRHLEVLEKMRGLIAEIESDVHHHGRGEAEVVRGSDLAAIVQRWTVEYLADRPLSMNSWDGSKNVFMGPYQVISERSGVPVRRVSAIANEEMEFVGAYGHADPVLAAIHMNDLLGTSEIPIIPNPNWSMEKWLAYMAEQGCR